MEEAVVVILLCSLPALRILTGVHPQHGWLVLSEVETLPRVDVPAYRSLEVLVSDLPISIFIKVVIDLLEELVFHMYPPVSKEVFQLISLNTGAFIPAQIVERLPY